MLEFNFWYRLSLMQTNRQLWFIPLCDRMDSKTRHRSCLILLVNDGLLQLFMIFILRWVIPTEPKTRKWLEILHAMNRKWDWFPIHCNTFSMHTRTQKHELLFCFSLGDWCFEIHQSLTFYHSLLEKCEIFILTS